MFDFRKFYEHARVAQKLMDDLVDIEIEQIEKIISKIENDPKPLDVKQVEFDMWQKIKHQCKTGRRTGCGITGLEDTIAALGLKYKRPASIKLTDKIYMTLKFACYQSSIAMAKELGHFEVWNHELEKNCPFFKRLESEVVTFDDGTYIDGVDVIGKMKKYERRNIALMTTAPAGSVSILTQTTSGIEPIFLLSYLRRKKINHNDKDSRVDFVDSSDDSWQEFTVYHPKVKMWMDITGETDLSKSPWLDSCADDLDWKMRVKLQAAAQKHVDHAISSTINLPEDVTVEKVAEIYEEAWRQDLKGITVYRKNCRTGVLVEKKNILPKHSAPERPKELNCDVHHVSVKGKKYFVLVGLYGDNQEPYEVFAGRGNLIKDSIKRGKIIKLRTSFYKAILDDESELSPITLGCNEDEKAITRLVSMSLRHGASLEFIIEQISKIDSDLTSFIKSIARALKKYVKDGTLSGEKCECGNPLIFEGGCSPLS